MLVKFPVPGVVMATIHAIYENGVFRPTMPVDLPEGTSVEVSSTMLDLNADEIQASARKKVYEILSQRFDSDETDTAERHNEHQP